MTTTEMKEYQRSYHQVRQLANAAGLKARKSRGLWYFDKAPEVKLSPVGLADDNAIEWLTSELQLSKEGQLQCRHGKKASLTGRR